MDATSSTVEPPNVNSTNKDTVGQDAKKQTNESGSTERNQESNGTTGSFECNICLDTAKDAVVSMCGHLFCWPCLHCWLETAEARLVCPVCKAAISRDKVIPLYGRGGDHSQDPRNRIPPRPQGRRTEPEPGLGNFGSTLGGLFGGTDGGNFRMSVGIGAFPLSFLAATFNFGGGNSGPNGNSTANQSTTDHPWNGDAEALSTLFLFVAIFFIAWLLIA